MKHRKILPSILAGSISFMMLTYPTFAADRMSAYVDKTVGQGESRVGLVQVGDVMHRYDNEGNYIGIYSGWVKKGENRLYYENGIQAYGWRKISGKWYYFDKEKGYLSTGKSKINGKTYYFDEKGRYLNKRSKSSSRPTDFNFTAELNINDEKIIIDTQKQSIKYTNSKFEISLDNKYIIPETEMQIFYSMLDNFNFFDSQYNADAADDYISISVLSNSKKFTSKFKIDCGNQLVTFFISYIDTLPNRVVPDFSLSSPNFIAGEGVNICYGLLEEMFALQVDVFSKPTLIQFSTKDEVAESFEIDDISGPEQKDFADKLNSYDKSFFEKKMLYVLIFHSHSSSYKYEFLSANDEQFAFKDKTYIERKFEYSCTVPGEGMPTDDDEVSTYILIEVEKYDADITANTIYNDIILS